jgi:hypothetical protein
MFFKNNYTKISIFLIILFSLFCGCLSNESDQSENSNIMLTKNINLTNIVLNEKDLPKNLTLIRENHTTEPSIQDNVGNGLTLTISEQYDSIYYDENTNDGLRQSILKLDNKQNALNLTIFSKNNLLSQNMKEKNIEKIGDESVFMHQTYNESNISYTNYRLLFCFDTLFVALDGTAPDDSSFINYAKTIEQRIIDASN